MKCVVNGKILLPDGILENKVLSFDQKNCWDNRCGKEADIIITEDDFNVLKAIIGGKVKYES